MEKRRLEWAKDVNGGKWMGKYSGRDIDFPIYSGTIVAQLDTFGLGWVRCRMLA